MTCIYCGESDEITEAGYKIIPVLVMPGRKTKQLVAYEDVFPDGAERKYLCCNCAYDLGLSELFSLNTATT